jgi:ketosteroid isomerase-like protein
MRQIKILLCSLVVLTGLAACAPPPPAEVPATSSAEALAAFKAAIRAKYDMKEKAFAAHDPEPIVMRFYAEDAVSVGAGFGIYKGREQLSGLYKEAVQEYGVKVISVKTVLAGNAGWDWADFEVTSVDPSKPGFTLAILFLWERQSDGDWICKGDFFVKGRMSTGELAPVGP